MFVQGNVTNNNQNKNTRNKYYLYEAFPAKQNSIKLQSVKQGK